MNMRFGNAPERVPVKINDVTLREGDQAPLTSFVADEKKMIALMLKEVGVSTIEAGFASSRADFENIRGVIEMFQNDEDAPVVSTLGRAVLDDTEASLEVIDGYKNARVHIVMATSDEHIQAKFPGKGENIDERRRWVLDAIVSNIEKVALYRKEKNPKLEIEFSPEDATGNALFKRDNGKKYLNFQSDEFLFLITVIREAIRAGANIINAPDTLGNLLPHETERFFSELEKQTQDLRSEFQFEFSCHIHNDMASATNNAIASIRGGTRQIELTTVGIGERTGNTSLHEVVGIITNRGHAILDDAEVVFNKPIQTELIGPTTRFVERILSLNKGLQTPFIGALSDVDGSGIHTAAQSVYGGTKNKTAFGGQNMEEFFSPRSGATQIYEILSRKFSVNIDKRSEIIQRVTERACREAETVKALYPARIYSLYLEEARGLSIDDIHIQGNYVRISLRIGGKEIILEGKGEGKNGVVDATVQAINAYLGRDVIDVKDMDVKSKPSLKTLYERFEQEVSQTTVVLSEKFKQRALAIIGNQQNGHGSQQVGVAHIVMSVNGAPINVRSADQNTDEANVKAIIYGALSEIVKK